MSEEKIIYRGINLNMNPNVNVFNYDENGHYIFCDGISFRKESVTVMSEEMLEAMSHEYEYNYFNEETQKLKEYIEQLQQENEGLKQKLNWIAFGDDSELALRYLRKIGYVGFDEKRMVYINKHNNDPFWLDDEKEKSYYIKDEELNEYTKHIEEENKKLKAELELYRGTLHENHKLVHILNDLEDWCEENDKQCCLRKLKELRGSDK